MDDYILLFPNFECKECGDFGNDASGFVTKHLCKVCARPGGEYFAKDFRAFTRITTW